MRSATSHSSTPPSSALAAITPGLPIRAAKKLAVNPQMHSDSVGQYASSTSRGQDAR